jgi:hypothetical protein
MLWVFNQSDGKYSLLEIAGALRHPALSHLRRDAEDGCSGTASRGPPPVITDFQW